MCYIKVMITKKCQICNKTFCVPLSRVDTAKFCSRKCKAKFMKGKPFFDSTGISSWNKGTKGLMNCWNKGKTGIYSKETLEKLRQAGLNRPPEKHSCWKGGIRYHNGYKFIFSPNHPYKTANKCVSEHRLIFEKHLNRFLKPNEVIHHINGIKDDNRIENLKLFSNNSEHIVFHKPKGRPPKLRKPTISA